MSQASQDSPLLLAAFAGAAGYVFSVWLGDLRHGRTGPGSFPGATYCSKAAVLAAITGALVLLGLETGGEYALGVSAQQSDITALYLVAMVGAAFGEELIFRGYLVVTHHGRAMLLAGILGFSVLFALLHPFLWDWKSPATGQPAQLVFDFSLKAWWSTAMVALFSVWLYAMRFSKLNPSRSLIPCFSAHLAKNLGVFAIKLIQGHVTSWW